MKKQIYLILAAFAAGTLLLTSCAKYPQAEVDQANQAIENARSAGADVYVPDVFTALQDSMKAAMEGIEASKSKLFKNYTFNKEELAKVSQLASEVAVKTEEKKAELKTQTQAILAEVAVLLEENKQLITQAPKGKEGTTALVAMKEEIKNLEISVAETSQMLEQGDILATFDKAGSIKTQATNLNTELKGIIEKYKSYSKGRRT